MAKIKVFAISCSSDAEMNAQSLYVWGGMKNAQWLPSTEKEARKRIIQCRKINKCDYCDWQIHPIIIERTEKTLKQHLVSK